MSEGLRIPTFADVEVAAGVLQGIAHRTPVLTSRTANDLTGGELFFKAENFQRGGAFKFRGAYFAISRMLAAGAKGILTFSSGNHAGAVALAGKLLGIPTTIVMPEDAPRVKLEATRGYGGEVILYDRAELRREDLARRLSEERNLQILPPYDSPDVIAGAGTCGLELFTDAGPLDYLLVPCGGGGLLSGCAIAAAELSPDCKVIGVEPENADDGRRSFQSGSIQTVDNPDTIADGARTPYLGKHNFAVIREKVHDMITVSDEDLVQAMRFCLERMKIVVEPTGALAIAAAFKHFTTERSSGGGRSCTGRPVRTGIVISGGNVDIARACQLLGAS